MTEKKLKLQIDKNNKHINKKDVEYDQKGLACDVENKQKNQRNFRRVMSLLRINDELKKEIIELKKEDFSDEISDNKYED